MTQKPDGGPAYPRRRQRAGVDLGETEGMTLRDYFAGQALGGLCGADDLEEKLTNLGATSSLSTACYRIADAMIAALEEGQ